LFKINKGEKVIVMAVNKNPYESWKDLRDNSDYRSTDTQLTSFVRQQLSQDDYLTKRNRVNSGPDYKARVAQSASEAQIPHVLSAEDMWGWQRWPSENPTGELISTDLSNNLVQEVKPENVPGTSYYPYNNVTGATFSVDEEENFDQDVTL
jgi:hypothetical protein